MSVVEKIIRALLSAFCSSSSPSNDQDLPQQGHQQWQQAPVSQQPQQQSPPQQWQQAPGPQYQQPAPQQQWPQPQLPQQYPQPAQFSEPSYGQESPTSNQTPSHPHSPPGKHGHHGHHGKPNAQSVVSSQPSSPPSGPAPYSHHTSPPSSPPHRPHGQDQDQINHENAFYVSKRAQANEEGDKMAKCFQASHEAYASGDGAGAKQLSNEGKEHQRNMESLNREASDWIFAENNKNKKPGEVDLHGLYVKEAITQTERAIQDARQRGDSEVHLIVGKGLHSQGGAAKIKPAIETLMQNEQLSAELDPHNAGVLIVYIGGSGGQTSRAVGPDEITRRLDRNDEGCIVM